MKFGGSTCACICRLDGLPVYEVPPEKYSAEQIIKILLDPNFDDKKICKQRPVNVKSSSTFVVDLSSLKDPDDVKKDNFCVWHHNGSHNPSNAVSEPVGIYRSDTASLAHPMLNGSSIATYSLCRLRT